MSTINISPDFLTVESCSTCYSVSIHHHGKYACCGSYECCPDIDNDLPYGAEP